MVWFTIKKTTREIKQVKGYVKKAQDASDLGMKTLDSELKEINKKFNKRIKEEKEYRKRICKKFS